MASQYIKYALKKVIIMCNWFELQNCTKDEKIKKEEERERKIDKNLIEYLKKTKKRRKLINE